MSNLANLQYAVRFGARTILPTDALIAELDPAVPFVPNVLSTATIRIIIMSCINPLLVDAVIVVMRMLGYLLEIVVFTVIQIVDCCSRFHSLSALACTQ
jgi:hypothetical protein